MPLERLVHSQLNTFLEQKTSSIPSSPVSNHCNIITGARNSDESLDLYNEFIALFGADASKKLKELYQFVTGRIPLLLQHLFISVVFRRQLLNLLRDTVLPFSRIKR
ncbi:unnamed protein product [Nezara viridula]|uniref:Uncharacterized protein n=1 Tax=Nezara viridula TaxID=85310 RepID=A0A9P0MX84_NEZVI|nr:unnamed protein product [Nezara viridula]